MCLSICFLSKRNRAKRQAIDTSHNTNVVKQKAKKNIKRQPSFWLLAFPFDQPLKWIDVKLSKLGKEKREKRVKYLKRWCKRPWGTSRNQKERFLVTAAAESMSLSPRPFISCHYVMCSRRRASMAVVRPGVGGLLLACTVIILVITNIIFLSTSRLVGKKASEPKTDWQTLVSSFILNVSIFIYSFFFL